MKDNHGFTLIELIIVIMIIGVLAAGSTLGANALGFGSAKSTVDRISNLLDYVQIENMTKNNPYYLIIEKGSSDNHYYLSIEKASDKVSTEKLKLIGGEITFQTVGSSDQYLISSQPIEGRLTRDRLEVCFSKETGGVIENRDNEMIMQIGVIAAGSSYSIHLVTSTGKHYIE